MVGFLEVRETERNYDECRLYTRTHARTFYFASHLLPREKRLGAYAVYAFCRYADNMVDTARFLNSDVQVIDRLHELRRQLRYVYAQSPLMHPRLAAFRETVFRYKIPEHYFVELLDGVAMDLSIARYETFDELQTYCYRVASVVGCMMSHILGAAGEPAVGYAGDLGTAMQLTNILRDIREDYSLGRVYLPQEDLRHFGVTEEDIARARVSDRFRALMAFEIERARSFYERADEGIRLLPADGSRFCVLLMSRVYGQILRGIEQKRYNIFGDRVVVRASAKLAIAMREAVPFLGTLPAATDVTRRKESAVIQRRAPAEGLEVR